MISSVPIRLRLTLPFALAMALVLAGLGVYLYLRVGSTLLASVDQNLRGQSLESLSRLRDDESLLDRDATEGAAIAEVLAPDGSVLESSPAGVPRLLSGGALSDALTHSTRRTVHVTGLKGTWRLFAVPAEGRVLVVGRSLDSRDESLDRLRHEFVIAAPLALLFATLAGYLLAGAALRPVEAMRRRASAITAATPGSRLPVPPADDEISRLAETINDMLQRLEAAFQHERRFVSDASHELRTPLALLRTELELALRRTRSREELEAALRSAAEETDRLVSLAEDLLLVARADQGGLPVRREQVHTDDILARVASRFAGRAGELGRSVHVTGSDLVLDADPLRLEQALGNLVANGLDHGAGTVELFARSVNGSVELHVTDEGSGFPPGFAGRAFDRFSRADESRGRGGSGLGLAIVLAIAEAHGGTAEATNGKRGADVWIALNRLRPL
jgi:two-component system OmpR family sensor kinase